MREEFIPVTPIPATCTIKDAHREIIFQGFGLKRDSRLRKEKIRLVEA